MELTELLLYDDCIKPYIKRKKNKIIIRIDSLHNKIIDANVLVDIQKKLCFVKYHYDEYKQSNIVLKLNIETNYFKDRTVVLLLEMMLFGLLQQIDLTVYLNIRLEDKMSIYYNFFHFSFLCTINRKFIDSKFFCKQFANYPGIGYIINNQETFAVHFRKYLNIEEFKQEQDYLIYQQYLSNDILSTLKPINLNEKTLDETCMIVDELVDNIIFHTINAHALIDIGVVKVKSSKDSDDYYQFMINVLNISENCLYTNIKDIFKSKSVYLKQKDMLEKAYINQQDYFKTDNYSEDLFFMVSTFQNGTTTRTGCGGTGLNKSIINFSKRSQDDIPTHQSYVYSGKNILLFNHDLLSNSKIGNCIAFNQINDYNEPPDKRCLSNSVFNLRGTAYNLMFIVKESENNEN